MVRGGGQKRRLAHGCVSSVSAGEQLSLAHAKISGHRYIMMASRLARDKAGQRYGKLRK